MLSVIVAEEWSLFGVFLYQYYFACHHLIRYACFFLPSYKASLSWMDMNYVNHSSCIPSLPNIFQFSIFLNAISNKPWCMLASSPSLSSSNSFLCYLSIQDVFFHFHTWLQNCIVSFVSGCWFVFVPSLSTCW